MLRYCITAGILGAGWFAVLLLPGITREWLRNAPLQNVACLLAASVMVALVFRRFIARASTFGEHLVRAIVLPYIGCLTYLSLWAALLWTRTLLFGGLANVHDTLSLYALGFVAAVIACFVVVPYGLVCQYVMNGTAAAVSEGDAGRRPVPERYSP
jgi:hypothetical protein